MKCGYCRRDGHNRTSCKDFKNLVIDLSKTVEQALKWDVVKNLIVQLEKLETTVMLLNEEMAFLSEPVYKVPANYEQTHLGEFSASMMVDF